MSFWATEACTIPPNQSVNNDGGGRNRGIIGGRNAGGDNTVVIDNSGNIGGRPCNNQLIVPAGKGGHDGGNGSRKGGCGGGNFGGGSGNHCSAPAKQQMQIVAATIASGVSTATTILSTATAWMP